MKVLVVGPASYYSRWIEGVTLVKEIKEADVVLFTGGADVHPSLYNESDIHFSTSSDKRRDEIESNAFDEATSLGKLILGVCRGAQLVTALSGGRLIQHVSNHAGKHHNIVFNDGEVASVNSYHHQMCWPFEMNKEDYELIAHSETNISNTYCFNSKDIKDSINEVEPEIIYFNKTNSLAIQCHPESMDDDSVAVAKMREILTNKLNNKNE